MTKMTLPMASVPSVISDSVADVLRVHGLALSAELLKEIGKNATQCLTSLDLEGFNSPNTGDLMAVGYNLLTLAQTAPGEGTGPALERVGVWLVETAKAELAAVNGSKAA